MDEDDRELAAAQLQEYTVEVSAPGGTGTAFFIAPSLLLTCAHVVQDAASGKVYRSVAVGKEGQEAAAAVIQVKCDPQNDGFPDLALLELARGAPPEFASIPIAPLGLDARRGDVVFTHGYSDPRPSGDPGDYDIEGWSPFTRNGPDWETLKTKRGQVVPGMSGAPLWNRRTGRVCGIIKRTRNPQTDLGGIIVSMSAFLDAFPDRVGLFAKWASRDAPPWWECEELIRLVGAVDSKDLYEVYDRSRPEAAWVSPQACPTLAAALCHLSEFSADSTRLQEHPVYRFAVNLAAGMSPRTAERIRRWVRDSLRRRGLPETLPGETPRSNARLCLRIEPEGAGSHYVGSARLEYFDPDGTLSNRTSPPLPPFEKTPRAMLKESYQRYLLERLSEAERIAGGEHLELELTLPNLLLLHPCEEWSYHTLRRQHLLGRRRVLILRASERDRAEKDAWQTRWDRLRSYDYREKISILDWRESIPDTAVSNPDSLYELLEASPRSALAFACFDTPEEEDREAYLLSALDAGLPVLLWGRECGLDRNRLHRLVHAKFSVSEPLHLPGDLHRERYNSCPVCLKTALIWDDPNREDPYLPGMV